LGWYFGVLKNYAGFSGRARRREYWMFVFYHVAAMLVLWLLTIALSLPFRDSIDGDGGAVLMLPLLLYYVGTIVPAIAVGVRRLHDADKSGVWLLMALIPGGVGAIIMIVFFSQEGDRHPNRYGPDPKAPQGHYPPLYSQQPVYQQPVRFQQAAPYQQPQQQPGPRNPGYRVE
jgi:uncharacterized membrane protein YhaH (DUF805 family)